MQRKATISAVGGQQEFRRQRTGSEGELALFGAEGLCNCRARQSRARCGSCRRVEPAISGDLASALYRIALEAHERGETRAGDAGQRDLAPRDSEVRLIEDDGVGFDVGATIMRAKADRRLGVAGMQERATLLGGRGLIESEPDGNGSTLYARLPMGIGSGAA